MCGGGFLRLVACLVLLHCPTLVDPLPSFLLCFCKLGDCNCLPAKLTSIVSTTLDGACGLIETRVIDDDKQCSAACGLVAVFRPETISARLISLGFFCHQ